MKPSLERLGSYEASMDGTYPLRARDGGGIKAHQRTRSLPHRASKDWQPISRAHQVAPEAQQDKHLQIVAWVESWAQSWSLASLTGEGGEGSGS